MSADAINEEPITKTQVDLAARKAERTTEIQLDKAERVATESTSIFDPVAYAQLKNLAQDLIAGGATTRDADTPEKLLVKLQAGFELGMKPTEASNSLYIVNGRVTIWGSALIGRLRKFGWSVTYKDESPESCTIVVSRRQNILALPEVIEDTFLYQDAVDSGYTTDSYGKDKVGWKQGQNRKLKMRYGAAAQLAKTYLPEVLGSTVGVAEIDQDAPPIEVVTVQDRKAQMEQAVAQYNAENPEEGEFTPKPVEAA